MLAKQTALVRSRRIDEELMEEYVEVSMPDPLRRHVMRIDLEIPRTPLLGEEFWIQDLLQASRTAEFPPQWFTTDSSCGDPSSGTRRSDSRTSPCAFRKPRIHEPMQPRFRETL